ARYLRTPPPARRMVISAATVTVPATGSSRLMPAATSGRLRRAADAGEGPVLRSRPAGGRGPALIAHTTQQEEDMRHRPAAHRRAAGLPESDNQAGMGAPARRPRSRVNPRPRPPAPP